MVIFRFSIIIEDLHQCSHLFVPPPQGKVSRALEVAVIDSACLNGRPGVKVSSSTSWGRTAATPCSKFSRCWLNRIWLLWEKSSLTVCFL